MPFVLIYADWYPTRFPYQMIFESFISNTTGATSGAETAYPLVEYECRFFVDSCCQTFGFCVVVLSIIEGLFLVLFLFGHCTVYPSTIYRFCWAIFLAFCADNSKKIGKIIICKGDNMFDDSYDQMHSKKQSERHITL
jgi:hypothetical protein